MRQKAGSIKLSTDFYGLVLNSRVAARRAVPRRAVPRRVEMFDYFYKILCMVFLLFNLFFCFFVFLQTQR